MCGILFICYSAGYESTNLVRLQIQHLFKRSVEKVERVSLAFVELKFMSGQIILNSCGKIVSEHFTSTIF